MEGDKVISFMDSIGEFNIGATLEERDLEEPSVTVSDSLRFAKYKIGVLLFDYGSDFREVWEGRKIEYLTPKTGQAIPWLVALGVDLNNFFVVNHKGGVDYGLSLLEGDLSANLNLLAQVLIRDVKYVSMDELVLQELEEDYIMKALDEGTLNREDYGKLVEVLGIENISNDEDLDLNLRQMALGVKLHEIADMLN